MEAELTSTKMQLLTVKDVADWLNVSESWVRGHSTGGKRPALQYIRVGGVIRFRNDQIEGFIRQWCSDQQKAA